MKLHIRDSHEIGICTHYLIAKLLLKCEDKREAFSDIKVLRKFTHLFSPDPF